MTKLRFADAAAGFNAFVEIPLNDFPALIEEIRLRGINAKVRTGGVTANAFPEPEVLLAFIEHLDAWVRASRLTARRAGLLRGPWRLSGRIDRRARA